MPLCTWKTHNPEKNHFKCPPRKERASESPATFLFFHEPVFSPANNPAYGPRLWRNTRSKVLRKHKMFLSSENCRTYNTLHHTPQVGQGFCGVMLHLPTPDPQAITVLLSPSTQVWRFNTHLEGSSSRSLLLLLGWWGAWREG